MSVEHAPASRRRSSAAPPGCRSRPPRTAAGRRRTLDDIEEAMRDVVDPELGINVVDLGLVYGIAVDDRIATIDMTLTSAACPLTDVIEDQARSALTGHGPGRRHHDQLGLDAAVGPGEDHRRRPRAAAGAGLPRLTRGASVRRSPSDRRPLRARDGGVLAQRRAQRGADEAAAQPPPGPAEQGVHGGDRRGEVVAAGEVGPAVRFRQLEEHLEERGHLLGRHPQQRLQAAPAQQVHGPRGG